MEHPIVAKILKEGIGSVDLSMLDEKYGKSILIYVGERLYKMNKVLEAIKILERAEEFDKLKEMGDILLAQGKIELATRCFIPTKDKNRLDNAAELCMGIMNYELAAEAYFAAGNHEMVNFIETNFIKNYEIP